MKSGTVVFGPVAGIMRARRRHATNITFSVRPAGPSVSLPSGSGVRGRVDWARRRGCRASTGRETSIHTRCTTIAGRADAQALLSARRAKASNAWQAHVSPRARRATTRWQIVKNSTDFIQRQTHPLDRVDERDPANYVAGVATLVSRRMDGANQRLVLVPGSPTTSLGHFADTRRAPRRLSVSPSSGRVVSVPRELSGTDRGARFLQTTTVAGSGLTARCDPLPRCFGRGRGSRGARGSATGGGRG